MLMGCPSNKGCAIFIVGCARVQQRGPSRCTPENARSIGMFQRIWDGMYMTCPATRGSASQKCSFGDRSMMGASSKRTITHISKISAGMPLLPPMAPVPEWRLHHLLSANKRRLKHSKARLLSSRHAVTARSTLEEIEVMSWGVCTASLC